MQLWPAPCGAHTGNDIARILLMARELMDRDLASGVRAQPAQRLRLGHVRPHHDKAGKFYPYNYPLREAEPGKHGPNGL